MENSEKKINENKSPDNSRSVDLKKIQKPELLQEITSRDEQLKEMADNLKKTEAELNKIKESEKLYKDQLIRMQADFENYKKREEKKKQEIVEYANQDLICQLLSVVDNLERASTYASNQDSEKHLEDIKEGLKGILKDFRNTLEREGLRPVKSIGEKFDPYCHDAIMHIESDKYPEDTVTEELVKGYYLKSKVIRPSVVKVSKGCGKKQQDAEDKTENKEQGK